MSDVAADKEIPPVEAAVADEMVDGDGDEDGAAVAVAADKVDGDGDEDGAAVAVAADKVDGDGDGDGGKEEAESEEKPADAGGAPDAMKSVFDLLDMLQKTELPEDVLKKAAAEKKEAERKREEEAAAAAKVAAASPKKKRRRKGAAPQAAKAEGEDGAGADDGSGSMGRRKQGRSVIPRGGKPFWNVHRTAELLNRALEAQVVGVEAAEPFDVFAGNPRFGDARGPAVKARARLSRPRTSRVAHGWVRAVASAEPGAKAVPMKGPFKEFQGRPVPGKPFDARVFGLPKQCSLSLGKREEPHGPGIKLGFPEMHGFPPEAVQEWSKRPASLQALESLGCNIERLSNLQSVALETFFANLQKVVDRHPELEAEFDALHTQVQDLRDLDVLMVNRAVVNFDLVTKTSKKIVLDSMPIDKPTFNRYWYEWPSRVLFPDVSAVRGFRRVVPDPRAMGQLGGGGGGGGGVPMNVVMQEDPRMRHRDEERVAMERIRREEERVMADLRRREEEQFRKRAGPGRGMSGGSAGPPEPKRYRMPDPPPPPQQRDFYPQDGGNRFGNRGDVGRHVPLPVPPLPPPRDSQRRPQQGEYDDGGYRRPQQEFAEPRRHYESYDDGGGAGRGGYGDAGAVRGGYGDAGTVRSGYGDAGTVRSGYGDDGGGGGAKSGTVRSGGYDERPRGGGYGDGAIRGGGYDERPRGGGPYQPTTSTYVDAVADAPPEQRRVVVEGGRGRDDRMGPVGGGGGDGDFANQHDPNVRKELLMGEVERLLAYAKKSYATGNGGGGGY